MNLNHRAQTCHISVTCLCQILSAAAAPVLDTLVRSSSFTRITSPAFQPHHRQCVYNTSTKIRKRSKTFSLSKRLRLPISLITSPPPSHHCRRARHWITTMAIKRKAEEPLTAGLNSKKQVTVDTRKWPSSPPGSLYLITKIHIRCLPQGSTTSRCAQKSVRGRRGGVETSYGRAVG